MCRRRRIEPYNVKHQCVALDCIGRVSAPKIEGGYRMKPPDDRHINDMAVFGAKNRRLDDIVGGGVRLLKRFRPPTWHGTAQCRLQSAENICGAQCPGREQCHPVGSIA